MEWPSLSDEAVRSQLMLAGVGVLGGAAVLGGAMWVIRSQAKHGDMLRVRLIHDVDPETRGLIASYLPAVNQIAARGVDVRVRFGPKSGGKSDEVEIPASALSETPILPEKAVLGYASSRYGVLPMTHVLDVFGAALLGAQTDLEIPASRQSSEADDDLDNDDELIESVLAEGADADEIDVDDAEDAPEVDQFGRARPSKHQLAIIRILPLLSDKKLEKIARHRKRSKYVRRAASRELERRASGGEALDDDSPVTMEMVEWYTQESAAPPPAVFAPYRRGASRPSRQATASRPMSAPQPSRAAPGRRREPAPAVRPVQQARPAPRPIPRPTTPLQRVASRPAPQRAAPRPTPQRAAPGQVRPRPAPSSSMHRDRPAPKPVQKARPPAPKGRGFTVKLPSVKTFGAEEAPSLVSAWMAHPVQSLLAGAAVFTAGVFLSKQAKRASSTVTSYLPSIPQLSRK